MRDALDVQHDGESAQRLAVRDDLDGERREAGLLILMCLQHWLQQRSFSASKS